MSLNKEEVDTIPKHVLIEQILNRLQRAENDLSLLKNVIDPRLEKDIHRLLLTISDAWEWINENTR